MMKRLTDLTDEQGLRHREVRMGNGAVMYNADYRIRLPAEPHKFRKVGCSAVSPSAAKPHVSLHAPQPALPVFNNAVDLYIDVSDLRCPHTCTAECCKRGFCKSARPISNIL